jgi:predicted nucleotidyltransferase
MNGRHEIESRREQIEAICREHQVARLLVFGAVLRDDFNPETSDVDLLVTFLPRTGLGWAAEYFALQRDLENLFERKVDLLPEGGIRNPYRLKTIERDQELLYAA